MSRLQLDRFTPATVVRATTFRKKYVSVDEDRGPGHQGTTTSYPCYLDFILRGKNGEIERRVRPLGAVQVIEADVQDVLCYEYRWGYKVEVPYGYTAELMELANQGDPNARGMNLLIAPPLPELDGAELASTLAKLAALLEEKAA